MGGEDRGQLARTALVAVGWGVFTWLVPAFAKNEVGVSPGLIGLMLTANAVTVVLAQVPVARFAEGRRRMTMMAVASTLFVAACLLVVVADSVGSGSYVVLLVAAVAVAVGECFHTSVLMPLVADLAPPALRGRYMAAITLSWWIGLAVAPIAGGQLLSASPRTALLAAAALAATAGAAFLALEPRLPVDARLTPRPARAGAAAASVPAA